MRRARIATRTWLHSASLCLLSACDASQGAQTLLERSAREPLRCEVTAELRDFGLITEELFNQVVRLQGGELWAAREVQGEVRGRSRLVVTPLNFSAEPGDDVVVEEHGQRVRTYRPIALPSGGFAVLWTGDRSPPSSGGLSLWFAAFDAAGGATVAPKQVEGTEPSGGFLLAAAVSSSGNIAALYGRPDGSNELAMLDEAGDSRGPARAGPANASYLVAAPGGGFVALGLKTGPDPASRQELLLHKVDETSESQPAPLPVTRASPGRTIWSTAALPLERGYLVAWSEARHPPGNSWENSTGGDSFIRIGRLDEQGQLTEAVSLRGPRDSVADRRPVLARFGELVALFWSSGPYNYDCEMPEACSHRDRGQFVLIDPDGLAPRSELVEVLRDPAFPNGRIEPRLGDLIEARLSVSHEEVLVTATLEDDDDTRRAPGFARVRCE